MYICIPISTNNKRVAANDTQTLSTRIVYMNNVHKHLDRQPIRAGVQSRDGCAIAIAKRTTGNLEMDRIVKTRTTPTLTRNYLPGGQKMRKNLQA